MSTDDIRWQHRFKNFGKAIALLQEAVNLTKERSLTELEEQGLIQRFEFTHELAWNVLKDYFEDQGNTLITGSRDAFNKSLIEDGEGWMEMIKSRNQSSHTYNEEVAEEIIDKIIHQYNDLFSDLYIKMKPLIR